VADRCFRIRTERNGGAWCPKQPISRDTYEWLEIDLRQLKVITQVETQGRFGYGQVRAWLTARSSETCISYHIISYRPVCVVVFLQRHFIYLFSCIAASLFNKLTYLLISLYFGASVSGALLPMLRSTPEPRVAAAADRRHRQTDGLTDTVPLQ